MIQINQALRDEAFYAYRTRSAKVWVSQTAPANVTCPLHELKAPGEGENASKCWFLELTRLSFAGLSGQLSYWIEEYDAPKRC